MKKLLSIIIFICSALVYVNLLTSEYEKRAVKVGGVIAGAGIGAAAGTLSLAAVSDWVSPFRSFFVDEVTQSRVFGTAAVLGAGAGALAAYVAAKKLVNSAYYGAIKKGIGSLGIGLGGYGLYRAAGMLPTSILSALKTKESATLASGLGVATFAGLVIHRGLDIKRGYNKRP